MNTNAKKALYASMVGSVLVVSTATMSNIASAADICTGATAAGAGKTVSVSNFIKVEFVPKCSANTKVSALNSADSFAVKSMSMKGKTNFGGSTASGSVTACTDAWATSGVTAASAGCTDT